MPRFRYRLTSAQQRVYDRSDATASILLRPTPRLRAAVAALPGILLGANRAAVERASQIVADETTAILRVASVRIFVSGTRPANTRGELHGLYTPSPGAHPAAIKVWMITAKRGQVVAFKTYLRTLLHEICHHLDYTLLRLPDSFHTDGFYRRESSLYHQVGGNVAAARTGASQPGGRRATRSGTAPRPPLE